MSLSIQLVGYKTYYQPKELIFNVNIVINIFTYIFKGGNKRKEYTVTKVCESLLIN